ncbi:hypothetical protein SCARD494_03463 [Seiridium cardinale]
MSPRIYFMRHAQGYHNLHQQYDIPDPELTSQGEQQCLDIHNHTEEFQRRLTHLVASPSFRCIRTAAMSFRDVAYQGSMIVLNPDIQEIQSAACNIPADLNRLDDMWGDFINAKLLEGVNYTDRSPNSPFHEDYQAVLNRAQKARVWLRELCRELHQTKGKDAEIVVVSHGSFLPFLTGNVLPWDNCQIREYKFIDPSGHDHEAALELVPE